jgi:hypothetical protein
MLIKHDLGNHNFIIKIVVNKIKVKNKLTIFKIADVAAFGRFCKNLNKYVISYLNIHSVVIFPAILTNRVTR